jgi:hypothetical protein
MEVWYDKGTGTVTVAELFDIDWYGVFVKKHQIKTAINWKEFYHYLENWLAKKDIPMKDVTTTYLQMCLEEYYMKTIASN